MLGTDGERPAGLFGSVPVSEFAILAGMAAAIYGYASSRPPALIVGLVICALGTMEVVGREHFTGYRAHTALLAAIPAIAAELGVVALFGDPSQRGLLLLAIVPVYVLVLLRAAAAVRVRPARPGGEVGAGAGAVSSADLQRVGPGLGGSAGARARSGCSGCSGEVAGSVSVNNAPPPGALATDAVPPCCSVT